MIGASNSRVSNWEQGINRPDADILAALCTALNVSPSELLNIHLSDEEMTAHERQVIRAYRNKADFQKAVNKLLDVEDEEPRTEKDR
jgi:transcriptional regulator with XRE-family HTH domain